MIYAVEVQVSVKMVEEPKKFAAAGNPSQRIVAVETGTFTSMGESKAAAITEALEQAVTYTDQISGDVKPALLRSV